MLKDITIKQKKLLVIGIFAIFVITVVLIAIIFPDKPAHIDNVNSNVTDQQMEEKLKNEVLAMSDPILQHTPYFNGEFEVIPEKDSEGNSKLIVYICKNGKQEKISSDVSAWLKTLNGVNPDDYYIEFNSKPNYDIVCK